MDTKCIEVVLAFSNQLISQGICKIVEDAKDIVSVRILDKQDFSVSVFNQLNDAIVLTDLECLYNAFPSMEEVVAWPKIILLDTHCGKENITRAVLRKRLCGVMPREASVEDLIKALVFVSGGKVFLDNDIVKSIINGTGVRDADVTSLTAREIDIVTLVGKGYRNKEIAKKLNIVENTVKTHLYRIFQKLGIKTRSELIAYVLKSSRPMEMSAH